MMRCGMAYYSIDEELAARAWEMVHMSDYCKGSATAEYRAHVDEAAAVAMKQKQRVSEYYHGKIDFLLDGYARKLADWVNAYNRNSAAYPSQFICGAGNFNMRKHNAQMAREDALWKEYAQLRQIVERQIPSIGTGPIDFADPHAKEMLLERIEQTQALLERSKAMNAYYRKHKSLVGFDGLTDEKAAELDEAIKSYPLDRKPVPDYELTSLRGKLKRAQERLAEYMRLQEEAAAMASRETESETPENHFETPVAAGQIVRNIEANRLQILFDEIPDAQLRGELKLHGFRWSPKNSAWQRQLTRNAEYDAKLILGL